jgi:hypothetical protein
MNGGFESLGARMLRAGRCILLIAAATMLGVTDGSVAQAQTVTASVNVNGTLAIMPEYGIGIHTSTYDNSLWHIDAPGTSSDDHFDLLPGRLDDAGVNVLRYPGGGYADSYHFSLVRPSWESGALTGSGFSPRWGLPDGHPRKYDYAASHTDFGSFVRLLDATSSKAVITVNTGSAIKYDNPSKLGIPTHNGQPQEAAAWVAYANGDPAIYGTANDIPLGVDAEGNNWKTAGYWAKLRASTSAEFTSWATTSGVYDSRNAFLAINRDAAVGIKYWEIGNETFGTSYYGGGPYDPNPPNPDDPVTAAGRGYAMNYAYPYDGTARDDRAVLSPAAYGQQVLAFHQAMKAVDPTIQVGAVLATPPGDYQWSLADLDDDGVRDSGENYWNEEVLSQTAPIIGKVADVIDFGIVHWYPGGSASQILDHPRLTIPRMIHGTTAGIDTGSNAGLRDSFATYRTDGNPNALEIFVTETDGAGDGSAGGQRVDGLFAADEHITFFENGVSNVDWLELHQTGTGSFLSEASNTPNFAYFGIQSVHRLAEPGDAIVPTLTTEADVRIHAAVQDDGTVAVMVINMNTTSRTVNVSINGGLLLENGTRLETNGDTALAQTALSMLGNEFSTTIAAQTLQLFLLTPAPSIPGDFDHNGQVNGGDLAVWRTSFGVDAAGDADDDGDTDGADLLVWQRQLGAGGTVSGASQPVPEPATALLALGLALAYVVRRRGGAVEY